jgi:hypothetical protein
MESDIEGGTNADKVPQAKLSLQSKERWIKTTTRNMRDWNILTLNGKEEKVCNLVCNKHTSLHIFQLQMKTLKWKFCCRPKQANYYGLCLPLFVCLAPSELSITLYTFTN